jgi:hypothetical protein
MKLKMLVLMWFGLGMMTTLYAEDKTEAPAMPVEVKKTVDSLAGHWIFDGSDTASAQDRQHLYGLLTANSVLKTRDFAPDS